MCKHFHKSGGLIKYTMFMGKKMNTTILSRRKVTKLYHDEAKIVFLIFQTSSIAKKRRNFVPSLSPEKEKYIFRASNFSPPQQ